MFKYRKTIAQGKGWVVVDDESSEWNPRQPLLVINDATVRVQEIEFASNPVRLTTDVNIDKYIYDVEHISSNKLISSGLDTTIEAGDSRKGSSNEDKSSNPVYAEYGDIVTYKIVLKNNQDCDVKVAIVDKLPDGAQLLDDNPITRDGVPTGYDIKADGKTFRIGDENDNHRIRINGNSEVSITVKILVDKLSDDVKENRAYLSTNNSGNISNSDFCKATIKKVADNKSVVNVNPEDKTYYGFRLPDNVEDYIPNASDYYRLNDYNLSINKYIDVARYQEKISVANNNAGLTAEDIELSNREAYTEEEKMNYPLASEQGDTMLYAIKVKNNAVDTEKTDAPDNLKSTSVKKATQVMQEVLRDTVADGLILKKNEEYTKL